MKFNLVLTSKTKFQNIIEIKTKKIGIAKYQEIVEKIGYFDIDLLVDYIETETIRNIEVEIDFNLAFKSGQFKEKNKVRVEIDRQFAEGFLQEEIIVKRGQSQIIEEVYVIMTFSDEKFLEYWESNNFQL